MKFIFVTGGVISGLGKGIAAASVAKLLKSRGYKVFMQKLDRYLNYDAGTLNPGEHGEVFVTDDGAETDLDLGHYERFIDEALTQDSSIMSGRVYATVVEKERRGDYLGKTVQVIPHLTGQVREFITEGAKKFKADIAVVEVGGTVGDLEGAYFLEAARQMERELGRENVMFIHLVYLPYLEASKELKSRPAQFSVRELQGIGVSPDAVFCRADHYIPDQVLSKVARTSGLPDQAVVSLPAAKTIYEVPLTLESAGFGTFLEERLKLPHREPSLEKWQALVSQILAPKPKLTIGVIAKYTTMEDTYFSIFESLRAAAWAQNHDIELRWVNAEELEEPASQIAEALAGCHGIVVPGGFGSRGIEGKIKAAQFARENKLPYFGLCLGMQIASIEFARNVLGLKKANSEEINPKTPDPVIHLMKHQRGVIKKGGTMRLGSYPCKLTPQTKTKAAYGQSLIEERHRHRFEFNNKYRKAFEKEGMVFAGIYPKEDLVEIIELRDHPFYIGVQFHPEFKSRPDRPHPLFTAFIGAAVESASLL
jgi:CTP synthase